MSGTWYEGKKVGEVNVTRAGGSLSGDKLTLSAGVSITENIQTASYTLVLTDAGLCVVMNSGSANNLTVPTNAAVPFPIGTTIEVFQLGAGQTTLVLSGLNSQSPSGKLKLTGQYSSATLRKRDTDTWAIAGDLSA